MYDSNRYQHDQFDKIQQIKKYDSNYHQHHQFVKWISKTVNLCKNLANWEIWFK